LTAHGDIRKTALGHGDTGRGSFEIWWAGRKIVVDGGVPAYSLSTKEKDSRGPSGQNVIAVEGIAPSLLHYQMDVFPRWYRELNGPGSWDKGESYATYTWQGFGRLRRDLRWTRMWQWQENRITITDRLAGAGGRLQLDAFMHFGENGWSMNGIGNVSSRGCTLNIHGSERVNIELQNMPYSPEYGVMIAHAQGILISSRVRLPFELNWTFEFDLQGNSLSCAA
jgi:hypothetical protein